MAIPEPRLGLVISYSYLWHHEYRTGRDEGRKVRPCVIVVALGRSDEQGVVVRVVPVTHREPDNPLLAIELPSPVKRHLGLDAERSWIILDELNEFAWPGFDLRPIPGTAGRFAYGFIPPRLFEQMTEKMRDVWRSGRGTATRRD